MEKEHNSFYRLEEIAKALFSLVRFNPEHGYSSDHDHRGASPQLDAELYDNNYDKKDRVYHHGKEWDVIRKTRDTE